MARCWNGFLPQNMSAKEEWALLEASQSRPADVAALAATEWEQEGMSEPVRELQTLMDLLEKTGNRGG